jgi:hypothetical protein
MLEFTEALYKAVTDEDGMVNADFNELTQELILSGFKKNISCSKFLTQMLKCITMKLEQ